MQHPKRLKRLTILHDVRTQTSIIWATPGVKTWKLTTGTNCTEAKGSEFPFAGAYCKESLRAKSSVTGSSMALLIRNDGEFKD
jgi:hypothetical protein